jgi:hypothetical protein
MSGTLESGGESRAVLWRLEHLRIFESQPNLVYRRLPAFQLPVDRRGIVADHSYNANHALWLSHCAALAYLPEAQVQEVVRDIYGWPHFEWVDEAPTDTQAFIMANDRVGGASKHG